MIPATQRVLRIGSEASSLDGFLTLPTEAAGLVVFAHGSGSSRFSPRNRFVADSLNAVGLGTLLFDLLTSEEQIEDERTAALRFDIPLLATRLVRVVDWLAEEAWASSLPLGLFGASTGAAAALICAAERPQTVHAVVSRGGRPDLAADALSRVQAPTLLIVGGHDNVVIDLNEAAAAQLQVTHRVEIVAGATHLFEEAGTLEEVARLAGTWFGQYLRN